MRPMRTPRKTRRMSKRKVMRFIFWSEEGSSGCAREEKGRERVSVVVHGREEEASSGRINIRFQADGSIERTPQQIFEPIPSLFRLASKPIHESIYSPSESLDFLPSSSLAASRARSRSRNEARRGREKRSPMEGQKGCFGSWEGQWSCFS